MKKLAAFAAVLCLAAFAIPALAADVMLKAPISRADTMLDKNGNEYVCIIVTENRTLNGVAYEAEVPVMAFGSQVKAAKALKAGEQFKGICASGIYQDRVSYTVLKVLNP